VHVLTVNTGSSSVKLGLYRVDDQSVPVLQGVAERIGDHGRLLVRDGTLRFTDISGSIPNHAEAVRLFLGWLGRERPDAAIEAVGHRIVYGGPHHAAPQIIDEALLTDLRDLVPLDPEHLPPALDAIAVTRAAFPGTLQVACFDTAFHRAMPAVAQSYPLPQEPATSGIIRYGFHGLSYEYIMRTLRGIGAADGRIVIAHLGNGSSMAAVREGRPLDTTMGFTPTGGLMMGTRSGDLDPGVLLYLLQIQHQTPPELNALVNKRSGLLGVSGSSADMRDLLARSQREPRAAQAVELYCYQARKFLGAMIAVLGGLDTLVFTGGIGENSAEIRNRICDGFDYLGLEIDAAANSHARTIISTPGPVTVRVLETNEDAMIAVHTETIVRNEKESHV